MSKCWQLGALMKKNLILMKRNCCTTICEIFFPIILMLLLVGVRKAIKLNEFAEPTDIDLFISQNSSAIISPSTMAQLPKSSTNTTSWNGLRVRNPL
jgi:hypothetical protein